ncbi:sporulation protein [Bacillus subtilis]|nr:sporulation sigma factor SigK [Bacillus amyloliquefaciens TA208]AEB64309.1 RNA polymerase sporulation-specific sigma factor (sigma-K) (C-terminal half) [Bacillus amyloliquefaciens LL3]AEK89830.1 RNA polymerase sporulation-specific sigma factor [Bacillus amyloliquefaciens XH7]AIW34521.1 sporulation protein [Bacillus subtilis]QDP92907.1 helix-turn-helix domain-containing protein [Bacillus amyloliquefaciens]
MIVGRFGLDLKKEKTQRGIAKELGISRSYVSRIEKRALMKMFPVTFFKDICLDSKNSKNIFIYS